MYWCRMVDEPVGGGPAHPGSQVGMEAEQGPPAAAPQRLGLHPAGKGVDVSGMLGQQLGRF